MKNIIKRIIAVVAILASYTTANAHQETPLAYLENTYPQLTELFRDELSNYPAHYIFAVDVSGSMKKYQDMVAQMYAVARVFHPNFLPRPNMSHMDSALAARWKMLTWKK